MAEIKTDSLHKNNSSFLKDFSWYFIASFFPLLIGFIKTPIFTRHFNKVDYGFLGIVTITFSFIGMFLFSWIGSCIWRFYSKYETKKALHVLYSNLLFLFVISCVGLLAIVIGWYVLSNNYLVKKLILYSFFQLFLNQAFLFYMVVVRLKGATKFYTIFQSIKALLSVAIALILVFYFNENITALISSLVIVDAFAIIFLIVYNPAEIKINWKLTDKKILSELLIYGSVGLILNISLLAISYSDRYIIAWLSNLEDVGIYDQVYKISQLSVVALVAIFFNTINPYLLKELEVNYDKSKILIQKYIKAFLIFGLPIIFYLSLFSKEIANILLGKEFRVGYTIMPFIFFSAYLHGIANFYELRLKFASRLKKLGIIALAIAILNILLSIILISLYGYEGAAVATLITYFILVILLHYSDREIVVFSKKNVILLIKLIAVLVLQGLSFIAIKNTLEINLFLQLFIGLIFAIIYVILFKKQLAAIKIPMN